MMTSLYQISCLVYLSAWTSAVLSHTSFDVIEEQLTIRYKEGVCRSNDSKWGVTDMGLIDILNGHEKYLKDGASTIEAIYGGIDAREWNLRVFEEGYEPSKEERFMYSLNLITATRNDLFMTNMVFFLKEDDVRYFLYTADSINDYEELKLRDIKSIKNSKFNISKPTKIIVHGWWSTATADFAGALKDGYLKTEDLNVITIGWPSYKIYGHARLDVPSVGKVLAKFLDYLIGDVGVKKSSIHLLGHSLGAHIAGIAGQLMSQGPLPRITGFDPAGPYFGPDVNSRLDSSDADFVDVIHTCGLLGFSETSGHLDFYPNGGKTQPGCGFDMGGSCSHGRSYEYYIASMLKTARPFYAAPCDDYLRFKTGHCCSGVIKMGHNVDMKARGTYYLDTDDKPPFTLGKAGIPDKCSYQTQKSPKIS